MLKKDQAVCLRTVDYSETSQIVTFFAKDSGKISALAKGSKRKKSAFDGTIETFSYGDIVFTYKPQAKLATLTEFQQQPLFRQLRTKLYNLNCAMFAAELISSFTHNDHPQPELFDIFCRFLDDIQQSNNNSESLGLLILFQISILTESGTRPVFDRCTNCKTKYSQNWRQTYFSSQANGFICNDCDQAFPNKIRLAKQTANCLNDIKLLSSTKNVVLKDVEKTLIYHFTELLNRPPKMAKFFAN